MISASADTLYVDDDAAPSWYDSSHVHTIQEGINNATINDTVYVYNGTYYENVVLNKKINLIGNSSKDCTIRSVTSNQPVIDVNSLADNSNISGFKFLDANSNSKNHCYGFRIIDVENCILNDLIISNVTTYSTSGTKYAYGLFVSNVKNTTFSNIYISNVNGSDKNDRADGIRIESNSFNNTFINCTIENISSDHSSRGISLDDCNNNSFDNIRIAGIYGNVPGFGFYVKDSDNIDFTNNCIFNITRTGSYGISSSGSFNLSIEDNIINNTVEGIYYELYQDGYEIDNDTFVYGSTIIKNNTINVSGDGINFKINDLGSAIYNDSYFEMGEFEISYNNITSSDNGISASDFNNIESELYDNATFIFGGLKILKNTISSINKGIFLDNIDFGKYMLNTSPFHLDDYKISNNLIKSCNIGLFLKSSNNLTVNGNTIKFCNLGVNLSNSTSNLIYNNYLDNTENAWSNGTNTWNIEKTSGTNIYGGPYLGGNYWSDYTGKDTNNDGLGETIYNIPGGLNKDNKPLTIKSKSSSFSIATSNRKPNADINGPYQGITGVALVFDGSSSYDSDGKITYYRWNFGNGMSGVGIKTNHTYIAAGTYTVSLTVTDNDGDYDIDYTTVTIFDDSDNDGIPDIGDEDDDDDGISDLLEIQLGSDPKNASDVTIIDINGEAYYLFDTNKDGKIDAFYNPDLNKSTILGFEDGKYLIDLDGDKIWDYTYTLAAGVATYKEKEGDKGLPGFELIIVVYSVLIILFWKQKRKL